MSEQEVEVPASLLKLEELRLDSLQYWARIRALQDRRNELRDKLVHAKEYERQLIEGRRTYDDRPNGAAERYEASITDQKALIAAIEVLMGMADAEMGRVRILEPTAALFRRAKEHYLDVTQGWVRDAV